jgi:hypothetical protein
LSARLERFDMTALIVFTAAGLLLIHGPLALLRSPPGKEVVKALAEATLVLLSDASGSGWVSCGCADHPDMRAGVNHPGR